MDQIKILTEKFAHFFTNHPVLGWIIAGIIIIFNIFIFIGNFFPKLEVWKANILIPVAKRFKYKKLVKAATRSDIRGNVNSVIRKIHKELPDGWLKDIEIQWVEKEDKNDFLNDNEAVIRMRPLENQNQNFAIATYYFFKKSFFPKVKRVIPYLIREASILHMCRRLIMTQKKDLEAFNDYVLEPIVVKRDSILDYLERFKIIDDKGFFTGTFLRETQEVAGLVRFEKLRKQMSQEILEILRHIEEFTSNINSDSKKIPDEGWFRFGPVTSYSFLLVAHPGKAVGSLEPYVKRAKEKNDRGAIRLYVFGTLRERWFAKEVIHAIQKGISEYNLIEEFELHKDYRGNPGGTGALFVKNNP